MEKYKDAPETTKESIDLINPHHSEKPYLNFIRIDKLETFDGMEGLIFFVSPDILSGLFTWANYDTKGIDAVKSPWGSGCSSTITSLVNENRSGGKHCFIGMLDVSVRPFFRPEILSFSIPASRFVEMSTALFIDYVLVIPGAVLAVITGVMYGIKTKWGFFKYRWLTIKWIVGTAIILIGTFGLHPLALEIINQASLTANESISFPSGYLGAKLSIVNYMALIQGAGLIFLIWVSVFKPWNKKVCK